MEDLARAQATGQPALAHMLLRAAEAERDARALPLRRRDADELAALEETLRSSGAPPIADRSFASLVSELTA
jgi:hypothetical protein